METPLLTLFGTSTAKDTIHQWTELYQSRPTAVVADVEGSDTTFDDLTPPSRVSNLTHIIKRGVRVSRTERAVNVAAVGDPYAFQKADQLRLLKMDMEYALLNSAQVSGASGVAARMDGIDAFITSKQNLPWKFIGNSIAYKENGVKRGNPKKGNPVPSIEITQGSIKVERLG